MKLLFVVIFIFAISGNGYTQKNKEFLLRKAEQETLAKVNDVLPRYQEMASNLSDYSQDEIRAMSSELQDLGYYVNQLIQHSTASQGVRPSPERLAVIKYWGKQIQPYNETLTKIALQYNRAWPYNQLIDRSRHLLNYTYADATLEQTARQVLNDEVSNLIQSRRAARLLVEHRIFLEEDIKSLSKKGANLSGKAKINWMATLAGFGIPGDVDFVLDYLGDLKFDDMAEDQHISYLGPIFTIMNSLGDEAELLREPLEKVKKKFGQVAPNYVGNIQRALDSLDNKKAKSKIWAINGSGYLDEGVDWQSVSNIKPNIHACGSISNKLRNTRSRSEKILDKDGSGTSTKMMSKWPIMLAIVLVLGGIFLWLRAKARA